MVKGKPVEVSPCGVTVTRHATERFIQRVAPGFSQAAARAYLTELAAAYAPHAGFRGRCSVDSRFGPLVLTVARVGHDRGGHAVVISVWPLRGRHCRGVRRLTA